MAHEGGQETPALKLIDEKLEVSTRTRIHDVSEYRNPNARKPPTWQPPFHSGIPGAARRNGASGWGWWGGIGPS